MGESICRFCERGLSTCIADLGSVPLANALCDSPDALCPTYPLRLYRCDNCHLVQVGQTIDPRALFSNYAYRSSVSSYWSEHIAEYFRQVTSAFLSDGGGLVVEIGSNDGGLLRHFLHSGFAVTGVEPAQNIAVEAQNSGVPTVVAFFGSDLARKFEREGRRARLLIANNVVPHVPDLNDFVRGIKIALEPMGLASLEFHYLPSLVERNQFDAIYHEHVSYFTLETIVRVLAAHELKVFDCERLATHGGSLRVWTCHAENAGNPTTQRLIQLEVNEKQWGFSDGTALAGFGAAIQQRALSIREDLEALRRQAKTVAAYGAPAKATTLLNVAGIGPEQIQFTVDKNPGKQGKWIPGVGIPIRSPETIATVRPDVVVNLCWNIDSEIASSLAYIKGWGGEYRLL